MKDEDKTKEQLIEELEKLRQELHLYETIVEKMPLALTVWKLEDLDDPGSFRLVACNPQIEKATGAPYREFVGTTVRETFPSSLGTEGPHIYAEAVHTGQVQELPDLHFPGDEQTAAGVYSVTVVPLGGRIAAMFCENITERKRAEEALRESEASYRELADSITDVFFAFDKDLRYTYWNRASEKLTGIPEKDAIGKSLYELFPDTPQTRKAERVYLDVLRTQQPQTFVNEYQLGGKDYFFEISAYPSKDGLSVFVKDITERKRAEEALQSAHRKLRTTFTAIQEGITVVDLDFNITDVNDVVIRMFGLPDRESVLGRKCFEILKGRKDICPYCGAAEAYRTKAPVYRTTTPEEEVLTGGRSFEVFIYPIMDEHGNPAGAVEFGRDITEHKRAEDEIRRHLERVQALREIDRTIASTLDLPRVLDIILEELERVIPYHSAGIFLFSDGTAKLTAGRGFPDLECALQVSFPVQEDALTREVLREKRPLILADAQADERFLARGGTEYVRSWIGLPLIVKDKAVGFLTIDHREPGVYDEESAEIAQAFGSQVAIAIENARLYEQAQQEITERKQAQEELRQSYARLEKALEGTIHTLVSAIEMRDPYTVGHQRRVTQLACAIAKEIGLPEKRIEGIRMAGLIHDMGKITIPAEILSKPGRLSDLEWGMIQAHPKVGYDVLKTVDLPWPLAQIVLQHHERMDGSGYPQGLSGEEIMLEARILAVADVVEAMASHRPYRGPRGMDKALEEISQNRGILYDPEVVDACLKLFTQKGFEFE